MIKVAIIEDNNTIREGLAALINGTGGYSCVGSFGDCESFLSKLDKIDVDVVLMDIGLPGMSGIDGIVKAKKIIFFRKLTNDRSLFEIILILN